MCRDNGSGMTLEHARRYLFRLYATSKERDRGAAGRFGVGFWAILRLAPDRIVVRSWPADRRARGWEVELDGTLTQVRQRSLEKARSSGTEVIIERARRDPHRLERRVVRAAWDDGRFLTCRDQPRRPLVVRVNGRRIAAPFDLPPPRTRFRHGAAHGVVALGRSPQVELFSRGLRVRLAPALDDLLNPFEPRPARTPEEGTGSGGASPRAMIESPDLQLNLARSDARDDRALRRVVGRTQRELAHLVARQIDVLRPRSARRRFVEAVDDLVTWKVLAIASLLAATTIGILTTVRTPEIGAPGPAPTVSAVGSPAPLVPLRDLAADYRGPQVQAPSPTDGRLAIQYSPSTARPYFAIMVVPWQQLCTPVSTGSDAPFEPTPYEGLTEVDDGVIQVRVQVASSLERVRLPVPTGQRVAARDVLFNGHPVAVVASPLDEPVVDLPLGSGSGTLEYRTAPAVSHARSTVPSPVPRALVATADHLKTLPADQRPRAALDWVQGAVRYAVDTETARRHAALAANGVAPVDRALRVGAGDCDVVNGLLAVVLAAAGVDAHLVVGVMGMNGSVGGLHAWVEYRDNGPWRVLDATGADSSLEPGVPSAAIASAAITQGRGPWTRDALPVPARSETPWRIPLAVALVGLAAAVALATTTSRRSRARHVQLDPNQDLTALLRGALEHPEAFASAPAVFDRKVLPIHGGGRLSLGEAWRLAVGRKLHGATTSRSLAQRVAHRGHRVLDTRDAGCQLVAASLGATDLDAWQALVQRSTTSALLATVARSLSDRTWHLDLRAVTARWDDVPGDAVSLDLPGPWPSRPQTVAVLRKELTWLCELERLFARRPAEATLRCAERVADALGIATGRRGRWRRRLSHAALHEHEP